MPDTLSSGVTRLTHVESSHLVAKKSGGHFDDDVAARADLPRCASTKRPWRKRQQVCHVTSNMI
jgi:hypothetical protein